MGDGAGYRQSSVADSGFPTIFRGHLDRCLNMSATMATSDLYADLGVDRAADAAAIHHAYRNAAKKAHPDAGGSAEKFQRIRTALLVLTDDARRKRYDETGEFDENQPVDNALAEKMEMASYLLDQTLGRLLNAGTNLARADLIAEMHKTLMAVDSNLDKEIFSFKETVKKYRDLVGRFISENTDEPNRFEQIIAGKIAQVEFFVATAERRKSRLQVVKEMLGEYRYRYDNSPQNAQLAMINMFQQAFGGSSL